ncbi:MAG: hypothetical protein U0941_17860 [Planctomycetaceae bacterium]
MPAVATDEFVEHIHWNDQHIATVIRFEFTTKKTTFVTPDFFYQQLGFVVHPAGSGVQPHIHLPLQRHLVGTPETLIVLHGKAEVDLFGMDKKLIGTWELRARDIILLVSGGHGVRFPEDTTLLEIKQGPYTGLDEKEPI